MKRTIAATAVLAALVLAGCGSSVSRTHSVLTTPITSPVGYGTVASTCNSLTKDWNAEHRDLTNGDSTSESIDFNGLESDLIGLRLTKDSQVMENMASVVANSLGTLTADQQALAFSDLNRLYPGIKADISARCPGITFS